MIIKLDFILLNTLILIIFSFIIYNIYKNKKAPKISNNIKSGNYIIFKSTGIAFIIIIPLIFIQLLSKKDIKRVGITRAIKI